MRHAKVQLILITLLMIIMTTACGICRGYEESKTDTTKDIESTPDNKIVLIENDEITEYSFEDLGIIYNTEQKNYDTHSLKERLHELNSTRQKTEYAKIEKVGSEFTITDTIQGNYIDIEKLYEYIADMIDSHYVKIDLAMFYEEVDITKPTYEKLNLKISEIFETYIKYTNNYEIRLDQFIDYLIVEDNTIKIDENKADELYNTIDNTIERELIEYDTYGKERDFLTSFGEIIEISGGTYGNVFSSDKETEYIIDKFSKFESEENRVPIYKKELPEELGNTYIEISIEAQHLWYYNNGEMELESDIVSGTLGKHDTPKGIYYISERVDGKYLTGETYKTWVNKWMRLTNRGHGLHDAVWRSSFGSDIYTYDGSHGCINLPKDIAYALYDKTYLNMPVIIY